jgi:hypothetical protein
MTYELHPYQKKILFDIESGGLKPGEIMVIASGRQVGKSVYNQYVHEWYNSMTPLFKKIDSATVDGEPWYTVKCRPNVSSWIRSQPNNGRWHETIDSNWYVYADTFDVCEQLYVELGLKFSV